MRVKRSWEGVRAGGREEEGDGRWSRRRRRRRRSAGTASVVDLDCFLQVGVATSLWSFVEMVQA